MPSYIQLSTFFFLNILICHHNVLQNALLFHDDIFCKSFLNLRDVMLTEFLLPRRQGFFRNNLNNELLQDYDFTKSFGDRLL